MDNTKGFARYLDRTLKKIQSTYLKVFQENNINLTIEQWVILHHIYSLGKEASQSEIAKINYRNRATTSRVISGLCKKDLVKKERFDGDFKRYKLVITDVGRQLVTKILGVTQGIRAVGYEKIEEQDFEIFLKVLNQIWENYDGWEK